MDDAIEKLTYRQRCDAFAAEIEVMSNRYGIHALVTSFCFDEEDGVKGETMALGCSEHCKMMFERLVSESRRYLRLTDEGARNGTAGRVH